MKIQDIFPARYTLFYLFIGLTAFLFLISACVTAPPKIEEKKVTPEKKLTPEEQSQKALEVFNRILSLTEGVEDRQAILPQMEALYEEIIENYPDVPLVEESYWRLITISIEEFKPPKVDKAEKLYQDFFKKYPDSPLEIYIEETFGTFYYTNKMWDKLLRFFTPQVKKFIKTGKLDSPYHMFMYSEAKFNLGDLAEAEKGYKIVIEFFPKTKEGETSKNRLEEIQNLKKQAGGA